MKASKNQLLTLLYKNLEVITRNEGVALTAAQSFSYAMTLGFDLLPEITEYIVSTNDQQLNSPSSQQPLPSVKLINPNQIDCQQHSQLLLNDLCAKYALDQFVKNSSEHQITLTHTQHPLLLIHAFQNNQPRLPIHIHWQQTHLIIHPDSPFPDLYQKNTTAEHTTKNLSITIQHLADSADSSDSANSISNLQQSLQQQQYQHTNQHTFANIHQQSLQQGVKISLPHWQQLQTIAKQILVPETLESQRNAGEDENFIENED